MPAGTARWRAGVPVQQVPRRARRRRSHSSRETRSASPSRGSVSPAAAARTALRTTRASTSPASASSGVSKSPSRESAATRSPVRAAEAASPCVGAPQPLGRSLTPAPSSTVRRIDARAPGCTRSASGSARQARTTWLSRNGVCSRWKRISAACSSTRTSAACRDSAARARKSPGRCPGPTPERWEDVWRRTDTSASASPVSHRAAGPGPAQASTASDASIAPSPGVSKRRRSSRSESTSRPVRYGVRASRRAAA